VGLEITWLGHASVLIELDGARLLTDPLVRRRAGPLVRIAPPVDPANTRGIDAVVISHLHGDHMHLPSLRRIERLGPLVAPAGAARWLERHGQRDVHEVRAGDEVRVGAVQVLAVPAEHGDTRGHPFGPKAAPLGYVMRGSGSVHFAGDTDLFEHKLSSIFPSRDLEKITDVWSDQSLHNSDSAHAIRGKNLVGAGAA